MHLKFKKPQNYRTIQAKFIFRLFIKRKDEFVFVYDLDLGTKKKGLITRNTHLKYESSFQSYGHVYT